MSTRDLLPPVSSIGAHTELFNFLHTEEDAKEAVRSAMDVWMAHTCIEFVPVESDEVDYIEFIEMYG